ncbi:hypothetical protein GCM10023321_27410 [Pseudonocardia eucalypti]|uniref:Uncharacterized protein n=1 Tax=Pseudonocardia eucalypti TaxID=648755 RepID=A0ABP9Q0I8_9PSEU|nr:hypothetical protein [Pseudonocardia eucalypti]
MHTELRAEVRSALRNLTAARRAELPYSAYLHRKLLQKLLDTADQCGIDTDTWLDRTTLPPLGLVEGPFTLDEPHHDPE